MQSLPSIPSKSIRRRSAGAALGLALLFTLGCGGGGDDVTIVVLPVYTVDHSNLSGVVEPVAVVRDDASWAALWDEHARLVQPPAPRPAVDFRQYMVIGVFAGARPTPCYDITISRVYQEPARTVVEYYQTYQKSNEICAAITTYPSDIVAVPRQVTDVVFVALN